MKDLRRMQGGCAQILHHAFKSQAHFKMSGLNSRISNLRRCQTLKYFCRQVKMFTVNFVCRFEVQNISITLINSMYLPLRPMNFTFNKHLPSSMYPDIFYCVYLFKDRHIFISITVQAESTNPTPSLLLTTPLFSHDVNNSFGGRFVK